MLIFFLKTSKSLQTESSSVTRLAEEQILETGLIWKKYKCRSSVRRKSKTISLLKPTGHVIHQQFNIQQLYVLPTLCLCVLYLSENKQRLVPLTAQTDWFL